MIQALVGGEILIQKMEGEPSVQVGDVVGIQETWAMDGAGNAIYMSDVDTRNNQWEYSGSMPEKFIRHGMTVVAIEKMSNQAFIERFGECIIYYKKFYHYSSCKKPRDTEWFRDRQWEKSIPLNRSVYAISYQLMRKEEKKV